MEQYELDELAEQYRRSTKDKIIEEKITEIKCRWEIKETTNTWWEKEIRKAFELGIQFQNQKIIEKIKFRIKDLKKRKPRLLAETSKYAMQMSIEELQELLKSINSQETKLDNNNRLTTNNSVAKLRTNSSPDKTLGEKEWEK